MHVYLWFCDFKAVRNMHLKTDMRVWFFFLNNVKIALTFFSSLQFNDFDDPVGCFFYVEVLSPFLLTKYKLYESLFEYGYSGLGFASLN